MRHFNNTGKIGVTQGLGDSPDLVPKIKAVLNNTTKPA